MPDSQLHRSGWKCWCDYEHDADVPRCEDCGDFQPGYHWRPSPKPWWWDSPSIRQTRIHRGVASEAERRDFEAAK